MLQKKQVLNSIKLISLAFTKDYILKHFNEIKENGSVIEKVIDLAKSDHIRGLSILGGEPMHSKNIGGTLSLVHKFKEKYPNKDVWVWTGFLFDDLIRNYNLKDIDVIIDGKYEQDLYNPTLKYRGSSNQRVIDVNKSLKKKKIMLYEGVE